MKLYQHVLLKRLFLVVFKMELLFSGHLLIKDRSSINLLDIQKELQIYLFIITY